MLIENYVILSLNGIGVVLSFYYHYLILNMMENKINYAYKFAASIGIYLTGMIFVIFFAERDNMAPYLGLICAIAAITMIGSPLANLKEVIEKQNADSIPLLLAVAATLNSIDWTAYGLILHDSNIWLPNLIGALLGITQLTLKFVFKTSTPQVFSLSNRSPIQ
jgi:solute carrier family 50 protein (sugar transporter)